MKRYLVFFYLTDAPIGGIRDMVDNSNSIDNALEALNEHVEMHSHEISDYSGYIYDSVTDTISNDI